MLAFLHKFSYNGHPQLHCLTWNGIDEGAQHPTFSREGEKEEVLGESNIIANLIFATQCSRILITTSTLL